MEKGPYIKTVAATKKEVCNYCDHCHSHNVYKRKSVDVLSAECKHPKVVDYCPSAGRVLCNDLDHDDTDVFTPGWCPVKMEASNYAEWVDKVKKLGQESQIIVDSVTHKDVLILFFLQQKLPEDALTVYHDFQRRYFAIQKSNAIPS